MYPHVGPRGYRMWTCPTCGHHSLAYALEACPDDGTRRDGQAAPEPRPARKRPARTAAKGGSHG